LSKINAMIVDDEEPARAVIVKYLEAHPEISIQNECANSLEAIKIIQEQKPDLLFLDVQMPKVNGFEMLELLEKKPVIIFSTAYDQFALQAFEASAADYLLKPYSRERFSQAVTRAKIFLQNKIEYTETVNRLIANRDQTQEYLQRVVVKDGAEIQIIQVADIIWLEAQDDYVMIHTAKHNCLKQKTMKFYEEHLPPNEFIRIHRSHIVRIAAIKQLEATGKDSYRVALGQKLKLPVSRSGYARLRETL